MERDSFLNCWIICNLCKAKALPSPPWWRMKAEGNCQCSGVLCFWSLFFFLELPFGNRWWRESILNIKNFLSGSLWQRVFFQYPFVTVARSSPQSKFSVKAEWDQIYWSFTLHWDAATGSALQTVSPLPSLPPGSFAFCDRKVFSSATWVVSWVINCELAQMCALRGLWFQELCVYFLVDWWASPFQSMVLQVTMVYWR